MTGWQAHELTPDRFDDFAEMVNRTRRSTHCWCVTHRLTAGEIDELGGGDREQAMRRLCERATHRLRAGGRHRRGRRWAAASHDAP